MESNTDKLRNLSKQKSLKPVNALKQSGETEKSSVISKIKEMLPAMPKTKTMCDIALFGAALFVIVRHGKDVASVMDGFVPTEQQMLEMINQQQGQPPSPM